MTILARAADDPWADRLHTLTQDLRCLVCQNESLADSNAPLALDLKREIRTMMEAGQSDAQIRDFLLQRYGDFVNYKPPLRASTALLWVGPLLLLLAGAWGLRRTVQVRVAQPAEVGTQSSEAASRPPKGGA
ncbi:cytochrome c-type biogenesis protein [Ottowia sp.]|uniref:cytochrome c-type biogenesis protein n=1 Tax=Ottowia sp. TaxID=1898956 RepID=UPI003A8C4CEE